MASRSPPTDDRVPPYSEGAEQAILGACLTEPSAVRKAVKAGLTADWFYVPANRTVAHEMIEMEKVGASVDLITVETRLKTKGLDEQIGGYARLAALVDRSNPSMELERYLEIVRSKWQIRLAIQALRHAEIEIRDSIDEPAEELISVCRMRLTEIQNMVREHPRSIKNILDAMASSFETAKTAGRIGILPCKLFNLNRLMKGWKAKKIQIVAARPGCGKTSFIVDELLHHSATCHVGMISLEMTEEELIDRMVANLGNLDMNRMYDGEFTREEFARFITARTEILARKIHILDRVHTASQVCAAIMDLWSEHKCALIGIDYLQMIMVEKDQRYKTRNDQVADHSNRILNAFRKTESAGLMASQLSREGTDEPQLRHLRDSGAIEQDAEKVLFIFPPEGVQESEDQDVVLKLDKHRTGRIGRVPAVFKKRYCRFEMVENAVQAEEIFEHHPPPWGE